VTSAQVQLALLSDRLKALMNDPQIPLGSQVVVIPADFAVDQPIRFSLSESIRSALRYRPEIQSAILSIDDASIRQLVARNARLPDLSIRLQTKWAGLDDQLGESYGDVLSGNFVNYVVGLAFEMPIGNRRAEGEYRRRVLERMQTVLAYRNTVQTVVNEVLASLHQISLFYTLIDQRYTDVLASADTLRLLTFEKEVGPGYTSERLELELNQQERLAQAEREHVQSLTQYNSALADLFSAMGTTLERNNIQFVVPTVEDALEGARGVEGWAGEPVLKIDKAQNK
jgi:outer membrane protein TolC